VKVSKANIGRTVDAPDPAVRFYLFYGPDEGQSRALAARLLTGFGASKFVLAASALKSDPAVLADEAAALSLFGGKRALWIEPAGDEIAAAVEALLATESIESPAIAIAGALRKTSALLKLAEPAANVVAFAAYIPEGADAERMVVDVGRRFGLKIAPPLAARIADGAATDQAIVAQELQKVALYLDASPQSPRELDHEALDAVGADLSESDAPRLADLALAGDVAGLADELAQLPHGAEAISVVRALQRRLLLLAPARARVERGESSADVMMSMGRALFFKEKAVVGKLLSLWDAKGLATVAERTGRLERELMFSNAPSQEALGEELLAIARAARRR
jgi:DNA polymerase-3 subunit delta